MTKVMGPPAGATGARATRQDDAIPPIPFRRPAMRRLSILTVLSAGLRRCVRQYRAAASPLNVESDYDLSLNERSVILTRDQRAVPKTARHRDAPGPPVRRRRLGRVERRRQPAHRRLRARHARGHARGAGDRPRRGRHRLHRAGRSRRRLQQRSQRRRGPSSPRRARSSTRGWRARSPPTASTAATWARASARRSPRSSRA